MVNYRSSVYDKTISLSPADAQRTLTWKTGVSVQPLGEVVEIHNGFTPDTDNSEFWENGTIPWVTLEDLKSKYVAASTRQITDKALGKRSLLPKNTVLWSSRATIGRVAITSDTVITNQGFKNLVVKDENKLLPEYLYYLLQQMEGDLKSLVPQGSKYKEINTETLEQFNIPVPSLDVQKTLIDKCSKRDDIVRRIDEKVAHGTQEIRRTLRGLSSTAKLSDLCNIQRLPITPQSGVPYKYIGLEHIERDSGLLIDWGGAVDGSTIASAKHQFKAGCLLYGKLRPYLNKVWVAEFDGICSTDILVLKPNQQVSAYTLAELLRDPLFVDDVKRRTSGTQLPRVNPSDLLQLDVKDIRGQNELDKVVMQKQSKALRLEYWGALLKRRYLTNVFEHYLL